MSTLTIKYLMTNFQFTVSLLGLSNVTLTFENLKSNLIYCMSASLHTFWNQILPTLLNHASPAALSPGKNMHTKSPIVGLQFLQSVGRHFPKWPTFYVFAKHCRCTTRLKDCVSVAGGKKTKNKSPQSLGLCRSKHFQTGSNLIWNQTLDWTGILKCNTLCNAWLLCFLVHASWRSAAGLHVEVNFIHYNKTHMELLVSSKLASCCQLPPPTSHKCSLGCLFPHIITNWFKLINQFSTTNLNVPLICWLYLCPMYFTLTY